ncbi:hypothetical protein UlMin_038346 [Ulmus minor]
MTGFGSSCGACKFLRRKCSNEFVFVHYFCYDKAATHFAAVHKVFGASNASKLLLHLPVHNRSDTATSISYEALARMRDPIYGCVAHIFALQQQRLTHPSPSVRFRLSSGTLLIHLLRYASDYPPAPYSLSNENMPRGEVQFSPPISPFFFKISRIENFKKVLPNDVVL